MPAGFAPLARIESPRTVLAYRTVPANVEVGELFALEAVVCSKAGVPTGLRIDAQMPEHRHGMNYRPQVVALGGGRYRADGLMLHMSGRWQLVFDVERGAAAERLTRDLVVGD
jgi:hypothetical protein